MEPHTTRIRDLTYTSLPAPEGGGELTRIFEIGEGNVLQNPDYRPHKTLFLSLKYIEEKLCGIEREEKVLQNPEYRPHWILLSLL